MTDPKIPLCFSNMTKASLTEALIEYEVFSVDENDEYTLNEMYLIIYSGNVLVGSGGDELAEFLLSLKEQYPENIVLVLGKLDLFALNLHKLTERGFIDQIRRQELVDGRSKHLNLVKNECKKKFLEILNDNNVPSKYRIVFEKLVGVHFESYSFLKQYLDECVNYYEHEDTLFTDFNAKDFWLINKLVPYSPLTKCIDLLVNSIKDTMKEPSLNLNYFFSILSHFVKGGVYGTESLFFDDAYKYIVSSSRNDILIPTRVVKNDKYYVSSHMSTVMGYVFYMYDEKLICIIKSDPEITPYNVNNIKYGFQHKVKWIFEFEHASCYYYSCIINDEIVICSVESQMSSKKSPEITHSQERRIVSSPPRKPKDEIQNKRIHVDTSRGSVRSPPLDRKLKIQYDEPPIGYESEEDVIKDEDIIKKQYKSDEEYVSEDNSSSSESDDDIRPSDDEEYLDDAKLKAVETTDLGEEY